MGGTVSRGGKRRADQLAFDQGLAESRSRAAALILAGQIFAGDRRVAKAGEQLKPETVLRLKGKDHPWVGRGGLKLDHAVAHFSIPIAGRVAIDVGASTGGFTDVLLHHGAARVYAVDVGHGQLAWKLRCDHRVVPLERINARYLTSVHVAEPVDLVVCDASFISLTQILPAPLDLAARDAWLVALIKPQFELGRAQIGKRGVVRDPESHRQACARVSGWLEGLPDWRIMGLIESPILGPEGNREFLLVAEKARG